MYAVIFEQPWTVGLVGTVLTVLTFYGWVHTGNSIAFKTGIGFAIVSMLLLFINLWVVTDAEQIRTWLVDVADELQANQYDKVLKRISPDHSDRVEKTAARMKSVKFSVAKVTKIHSVKVDYRGAYPTAEVRMNAFVEAESSGVSGKVPRWVGLKLEKRNNEWLIDDFEDREPQHEFMNSSSFSETIGQGIQGVR